MAATSLLVRAHLEYNIHHHGCWSMAGVEAWYVELWLYRTNPFSIQSKNPCLIVSILFTIAGGWVQQQDALALWVFQLIFNLFWNPLFFLKHDMALALFDIGVLWGLIIVLIGAFCRIEPSAGYIQLPYLAWVSFASVLNYTLLKLNTEPVS